MLTTAEILKKYSFNTKKSFGQNFLLQTDLLAKIVSYAKLNKDCEILEVGPGLGSLTAAILEQKPKKLISVEADYECVDILNKEVKPFFSNFEVINGDALLLDECQLFNDKFNIVANLPYNIGTSLLLKWVKNCSDKIENMTLLLQKEVVERITAKPNTKEYGRLSVLCQYVHKTKKCFDISPNAFYPKPKVTSSLVRLELKKDVDRFVLDKLFYITSIFFRQKRKIVRNNIKNSQIEPKILQKAGIDANLRAESLAVDDFVAISKLLSSGKNSEM